MGLVVSSMCSFCVTMHRYTSLIWDSNKKTFLGKNGVSWLSIILGTLVVIICVGIFIHCIAEVKKSRQESDARMRRTLIKKHLIKSSKPPIISANLSLDKILRPKTTVFDNKGMIVLKENRILADDFEKLEDLEEANDLRLKRDLTNDSIDRTEIPNKEFKKQTLPVVAKNKEGLTDPIRYKIGKKARQQFFGKLDLTKTKCKRDFNDDIRSFLNKLAEARMDRLKREQAIYHTLGEVFGKVAADSKIKVDNWVALSPLPKESKKLLTLAADRSKKESLGHFLNKLATGKVKRETTVDSTQGLRKERPLNNQTNQNWPAPDDSVMNLR